MVRDGVRFEVAMIAKRPHTSSIHRVFAYQPFD
jgi:hypothetical protein